MTLCSLRHWPRLVLICTNAKTLLQCAVVPDSMFNDHQLTFSLLPTFLLGLMRRVCSISARLVARPGPPDRFLLASASAGSVRVRGVDTALPRLSHRTSAAVTEAMSAVLDTPPHTGRLSLASYRIIRSDNIMLL